MIEAEVALAVSPRLWADALHQFLVDHGGGRVRAHVMGPEDAVNETYQVLVIDDFCSFLTPRLVSQLIERGRRVLGVYDPDEFPDGKQRLLEAGVDEVIEAAAQPEEFLGAITRLAAMARIDEEPAAPFSGPGPSRRRRRVPVTVVGGPIGGGATEVAVALAARLADSYSGAVLVDGDDLAPSVAQRLGLPLYPNLRTAVDALQHRRRGFDGTLHELGRLQVLAGLAGKRDWAELRPSDVVDLVAELALSRRHVVVNVGSQLEDLSASGWHSRYGLTRALIGTADQVVAVGIASPVGVTRLVEWAADVAQIRPAAAIHLVVNRAPLSAFRRGELIEAVGRGQHLAGVWFIPHDPAVEAAAWDGTLVRRGSFMRAIQKLTEGLAGSSGSPHLTL